MGDRSVKPRDVRVYVDEDGYLWFYHDDHEWSGPRMNVEWLTMGYHNVSTGLGCRVRLLVTNGGTLQSVRTPNGSHVRGCFAHPSASNVANFGPFRDRTVDDEPIRHEPDLLVDEDGVLHVGGADSPVWGDLSRVCDDELVRTVDCDCPAGSHEIAVGDWNGRVKSIVVDGRDFEGALHVEQSADVSVGPTLTNNCDVNTYANPYGDHERECDIPVVFGHTNFWLVGSEGHRLPPVDGGAHVTSECRECGGEHTVDVRREDGVVEHVSVDGAPPEYVETIPDGIDVADHLAGGEGGSAKYLDTDCNAVVFIGRAGVPPGEDDAVLLVDPAGTQWLGADEIYDHPEVVAETMGRDVDNIRALDIDDDAAEQVPEPEFESVCHVDCPCCGGRHEVSTSRNSDDEAVRAVYIDGSRNPVYVSGAARAEPADDEKSKAYDYREFDPTEHEMGIDEANERLDDGHVSERGDPNELPTVYVDSDGVFYFIDGAAYERIGEVPASGVKRAKWMQRSVSWDDDDHDLTVNLNNDHEIVGMAIDGQPASGHVKLSYECPYEYDGADERTWHECESGDPPADAVTETDENSDAERLVGPCGVRLVVRNDENGRTVGQLYNPVLDDHGEPFYALGDATADCPGCGGSHDVEATFADEESPPALIKPRVRFRPFGDDWFDLDVDVRDGPNLVVEAGGEASVQGIKTWNTELPCGVELEVFGELSEMGGTHETWRLVDPEDAAVSRRQTFIPNWDEKSRQFEQCPACGDEHVVDARLTDEDGRTVVEEPTVDGVPVDVTLEVNAGFDLRPADRQIVRMVNNVAGENDDETQSTETDNSAPRGRTMSDDENDAIVNRDKLAKYGADELRELRSAIDDEIGEPEPQNVEPRNQRTGELMADGMADGVFGIGGRYLVDAFRFIAPDNRSWIDDMLDDRFGEAVAKQAMGSIIKQFANQYGDHIPLLPDGCGDKIANGGARLVRRASGDVPEEFERMLSDHYDSLADIGRQFAGWLMKSKNKIPGVGEEEVTMAAAMIAERENRDASEVMDELYEQFGGRNGDKQPEPVDDANTATRGDGVS